MGFTSFTLFLAIGMCVTGSLNTLSAKLVNVTESTGLYGDYKFDHPFVQTAAMFLGESLCLIVFSFMWWRSTRADKLAGVESSPALSFPFYIFAMPAALDLTATCIMNVGLVYTYASVFQMMRGSVVIFTGLLSFFVFKRKLGPHKILGMVLVLAGLACVGSASVIANNSDDSSAPNPLVGALLVVLAQIVVSVQMVVEEKFISQHDVPALLVPGFEGIFGLFYMIVLLLVFYQIPHLHGLTNDAAGNHFENSLDAFAQIRSSYVTTLGLSGYVCSIAFFNYFGASVTKHVNATTRMVLDNVRTVVIWAVDLIIKWEQFQFMQVIGFILLLLGTAVYNEIVAVPIGSLDYRKQAEEQDYQRMSLQNQDVETNNFIADPVNGAYPPARKASHLHQSLLQNGHSDF